MLHIAGGAYLEDCIEPHWSEFYGSGVRAAAAISSMCPEVVLSTYAPVERKDALESIAAAFNFTVHISDAKQIVQFKYLHGLAVPVITPSVRAIARAAPLHIKAPNVLRFGFLDGEAVVTGDRVVYDPQDAYAPAPFGENESTAAHLAIVANAREANHLAYGTEQASDTDIAVVGKKLLNDQKAEVVVIKQGSLGALVITASETRTIPVYRTDMVFPLGSGDVFAAVFACQWAEHGNHPFDAAEQASRATADYCDSRTLPITLDVTSQRIPVASSQTAFPHQNNFVYLAGPFFTMAERWLIEECRNSLRLQGFQVFSPFHDVGHGLAEVVVPADIKALDSSNVVFAVADGLDAGTLFEIGYARARGKPVIAFVQNESKDDLKMLEGTGCEITDDFVTAIYRTVWAAMGISSAGEL